MNIFNITIFLLFFIFIGIFPGAFISLLLTKEKQNFNLLDKVILSAILSPFVLVPISFLQDFARIPQSTVVLVINLVVVIFANFFLIRKYNLFRRPAKDKNTSLNAILPKLILYLLFLSLLIIKILPVLNQFTPLLHDPIAHSEWLKFLNENKFTTTENIYPQGFEYFLNYFATFSKASFPKIVLNLTTFFTAIFPISMFYLGLLLTKKGSFKNFLFPCFLLFFSLLVAYPNNFYFTAGKNSMIMAFSIVPILLYYIFSAQNNIRHIVLPVLIFSVFIVHYPTGAVIFASYFLKILIDLLVSYKNNKKAFTSELYKFKITSFITLVIISAATYKIFSILQIHPMSNEAADQNMTASINSVGIHYYLYRGFTRHLVTAFGIPFISLSIGGLTLLYFLKTKTDQARNFIRLNFISFVFLYFGLIILLLFENKFYAVMYGLELQYYVTFLILIIISWFSAKLISNSPSNSYQKIFEGLSFVTLIFMFLFFGHKDYKLSIQKYKELSTFTQGDLDAFKFINSIKDEKRILIQMVKTGDVVFGTDGGVWIPSYTGKKVDVDFSEFVKPRSYEVYEDYSALVEKGSDKDLLRKIYCEQDIGYLYYGDKPVFGPGIPRKKIEESPFFEKIYEESSNTALYKITGIDCE